MIKIEVWSDVSCPFCWLGKTRLDQAIASTGVRAEVVMRSFQLNPELKTDPSVSLYDYLHHAKGYPLDQVRQINIRLSDSGREAGLEFNFEKVVVANTWRAQALIKYANSAGVGTEVTASLFRAYFSHGKNVDDLEVLKNIAEHHGLDGVDFLKALDELRFNADIMTDLSEAASLKVRGVPFFVFNRKFAVSGAQELSVFEQALRDSEKG